LRDGSMETPKTSSNLLILSRLLAETGGFEPPIQVHPV
jgi:hypothetical protein